MRGLRVALVVCLMLPLAGCLSDDSDPGPSPEQESTQDGTLARDLEAQSVEATAEIDAPAAPTRDDWFLLETEATPNGTTTGFVWTVPDGSQVPAWYDETESSVILEVAPIVEGRIDQWGLFILGESTGSTHTIASVVATGSEYSGTATVAFNFYDELETDPFYLDLWRDVRDGDELRLVIAASGEGNLGLAFRLVEEDPWAGEDYQWPSETTAEFLAAAPGRPWLPRETGGGEGFSYASYREGTLLYALDYVETAGQVEREERLLPPVGPTAPLRDTSIRMTDDTEQGFTSSAAWFYPGNAAATWDLHGTSRSLEIDESRIVAETEAPVTGAGWLVFGMPYANGAQSGPGGFDLQMDIFGSSAGRFRFLYLEQVSFGTPIEEITGRPFIDTWDTYDGLLGEIRIEGGSLILESASETRLRFVGDDHRPSR